MAALTAPISAYTTKPNRSSGASSTPNECAMREGRPTASAPTAPMKLPATLYQAKRRGRSAADVVCDSAACSVGTKTLTSPADGFRVPSTATTSSGQNEVRPRNPIPVAHMSADAPSRTVRRVR
jgi:hypothetical protein